MAKIARAGMRSGAASTVSSERQRRGKQHGCTVAAAHGLRSERQVCRTIRIGGLEPILSQLFARLSLDRVGPEAADESCEVGSGGGSAVQAGGHLDVLHVQL